MIDASLRRLKVFKTVVDAGGFNVAAQQLGIAQPSVGAHVAALERQVGHVLLRRRRGARPQLTEAGRAIYALAEDVVRRAEATAQVLAGLKSSQAREIVIAAHRDLAAHFLPPRLGRFTQTHSRIRIITRIGTIDDVLALVQSGSVQLGVLLSVGAVKGATSEVVGIEPLDLVVAASHPLARKSNIVADDLTPFAFVTGLRQSRYFAIVDRALKSIGMTTYDVALELQEAAAVKEAVRHGRSIACLPRSTVVDEIEAGALAALRLHRALKPLQIRCIYADKPGPLAARLIAALRQEG